jgi:hypothetical protein
MKRFRFDFIEYPDAFDEEEMNAIYGGNTTSGLCIVFTNCKCNTSNRLSYSCKNPSENAMNTDSTKNVKHKFIKRVEKTLCFAVTIR